MAGHAAGGGRRRGRPAEPAAPGPAWLPVGLAIAGVAVAGSLAWSKLWGAGAVCVGGDGCSVVQASPYAELLGLPTALWGVLLYVAVGVLAGLGLTPRRWLWAFVLVVAGVTFSAYLTGISLTVVRAVCGTCLVSLVLLIALLGALLWGRPEPAGRRAATHPRRLVWLTGAVAALTLLGGIGGFALGPRQSSIYQLALARHLRATQAVMYGAYW